MIIGGYALRKPNIRRKMRVFKSLVVSKNRKRGTHWDFPTSILLQNIKKLKEPLETFKNFQKKSFMAEKRSHSAKKVNKVALLLWNGFVFHVRDFGCVQNEVLSTYGKSTQCTKGGPIALN